MLAAASMEFLKEGGKGIRAIEKLNELVLLVSSGFIVRAIKTSHGDQRVLSTY